MKKIIAILMSFSLLTIIPVWGMETISDVELLYDENSVISDELYEIISQRISVSSCEKIPVSIEFDDSYDAMEIEEQAYKLASVDKQELWNKELEIQDIQLNMKIRGKSIQEIERFNEEYQGELMQDYNKVASARMTLNKEHVEKAMENFIRMAEIPADDIEKMGSMIPIIPLVWLTPEKVLELA